MLKKRIEILRTAQVINDDVAESLNKVIDYLEDKNFENSKMEMFTTHMAMALERIRVKAEVEELDDFIWNDVCKSENFDKAKDLLEELRKLVSIEVTGSEEKFLLMHLCNLLQE